MRRVFLLLSVGMLLAARPAKAPPLSGAARFERAAFVWAARYRIDPALAHEIVQAARSEQMPVGMAFRLVRRESGFRVRALGRAGEIGLTQIKPGTARLLAPQITVAALYQPRINLRLGFRYAVRITRRHHGDWYRGLTGYHLGPRVADTLSLPRDSLTYASGIILSGD
jgi:soluble lytic murein transglycosylase-like protein